MGLELANALSRNASHSTDTGLTYLLDQNHLLFILNEIFLGGTFSEFFFLQGSKKLLLKP